MAGDVLIESALRQLKARLSYRVDVADLIDEVADHLITARDRLTSQGIGTVEASRAALEQFGDLDIVSAAMTVGFERRFSLPTRFTRVGGWLAGAGGLAWLVMLGGWWFSLRIEAGSGWSSGSEMAYVVGAAALFGGGVCNVLVVAALRRRLGGLGRAGAIGLTAAVAAAIATVFGWMVTVWVPLLAVATASLAIPIVPGGRAPRWPILLFGSSWTISAFALLVDRVVASTTSVLRDLVWVTLGGVAAVVAGVTLWRWLAKERSPTWATLATSDPPEAVWQ